VNTGIEVAVVRKLLKELEEKKLKIETMAGKTAENSKKKIEEIDQKERRAIVMVILNGSINLSLRFSEIFIFLNSMGSLFPTNTVFIFLNGIYELPNLVIDVSYLAYILTFITNVLMYYFFNDKFKMAFAFWSSPSVPDKTTLDNKSETTSQRRINPKLSLVSLTKRTTEPSDHKILHQFHLFQGVELFKNGTETKHHNLSLARRSLVSVGNSIDFESFGKNKIKRRLNSIQCIKSDNRIEPKDKPQMNTCGLSVEELTSKRERIAV
jgi:hypothetical protein